MMMVAAVLGLAGGRLSGCSLRTTTSAAFEGKGRRQQWQQRENGSSDERDPTRA